MIDPRTIILCDDGRYVTLGRHSEPSEAEISAAAQALAAQGVGGWLATMSGTAYQRRCPKLEIRREIAAPRHGWDSAVAAFKAAHAATQSK
ncbi:hypothetical protein UFOVP1302_35 [uncultured Caudovirales phage]|uniref:Uncharacterized protein n=1 Tax=uncultured Caudovirales phage TaxID=2100421 RepID=A0A6J5PPR4_9CAUD|nr:hypothetical protein UFOVP895_38 [uncultured Caudovirales phage]CAB4181589.1 hypothetical protein UFOVP1070_49 [uncultured Caudovirales phage]CAB4195805.1 hypothetical protein UFOVP1302_35 [uncultured Caudovirales phage]CAB4211959.1 hypothetical protein UFOVP1416_77 [uncultured Caudovirales phage]